MTTTNVDKGAVTAVTRDSLRAAIFKTRQPKSKIIQFFDAEIEIRQSQLGDIISAKENEDRQAAVIETLVNNAFVPGTDIKVFEMADAESFKAMPFGADFIRVTKALEELSEVNFLDKKGASTLQQ